MQSRKIIKKLVQITAMMLLLFFALPATAFLLLQSNRIQTNLADHVMHIISKNLDTKFTISKIDISFFYRIRLNDVYLQDLSGDTLLYVESLTAGIRYVNPIKEEISIGSVNFNKAIVKFALDSAGNLNLRYFINKLKGNGKGEGGLKVKFSNLRMRDSRFSLRSVYSKPVEFGMNYTDMQISDIDADIKRFKPSKDSLSFFIKSLSMKEKSGFKIDDLTAEFSENKTFLSFRDLSIRTPYSEISGPEISLHFDNWGQFKADSLTKFVKIRADLIRSKFNLHDIGYFAPAFRNTNQLVSFTGKVNGPISNLKGKQLDIGFGSNTKLVGELKFEGLPDIRETFILADISDLTTSASDISALELPGRTRIRLPEQVEKLGVITYKGNFTGFFNDFVAYGQLNTGLGILNTDLLFRPDTSNYLDFEGKLIARDFDLGTLLDASRNIGKINLTATINGATLAGKSINASLKGLIQSLEFRQYKYTNINLTGNLNNKTFNGSINMNDPNAELEFLGKVNLTDSIAAFDFTANITDANLYALNIDKSDPDFRASFYLIANARGNSINSLNGEVKLLNSLFTKKDKQLQIYDFSLFSENKAGSNRITLRSDFMDADLKGNYELTKIGDAVKYFILSYLPSLADSSVLKTAIPSHSLELEATIKNAKPLFDFFLPDYSLAENSKINVTYKPDSQILEIILQTSKIKAKGITWNDLNANLTGRNDSMDIEAGGSNLTLGKKIKLENFTLLSDIGHDSAGITIRWNNWQDLQYKGNISALGKISRQEGNRFPHFEIELLPSSFVSNDTLWTIRPGKISIDSTQIAFDNLVIDHGNEYFKVDGALSEIPSDKMNLLFHRFDLGNMNGIAATSGYKFGGILNGSASVSNVYANTLFTSLLKIDSLMINNEMLGNAEISSKWDNDLKAVSMQAHAMRDNLKTIELEGEYFPTNQGKLDFTLNLNKLRMNLFNPYVKVVFSDLRGAASGRATLAGTVAKPLLNGELDLQKTTFTINYLKTRYNFTEKVQIENNNIYFKDVRIYDPKGNSAYLTGAIRNTYLKDFQFDLSIRSQDFLCMNTTQADNNLFYGTAYATGNIKISGPPKNITMDIQATTGKNTSIKIPLSNTGKLDEYQFISIVNEDEEKNPEDEETDYQVNLSGMQINFGLTVTPDAEVQIIFDPKLGDIIKGKGNGNLDMKISTSGNFLMYGEYNIEEGDYLFTLQNIINKKLTIEPGGTIRWDGDPFNSTIDIVANYVTKASLKDLLGNGDDRKISVNDRITMTGKLMTPNVKYDIYLPNADESTRLMVNSAISSSEELNKQFISLLTLNRFYLSTTRSGMQPQGGTMATPYSNAAGVNASEFLSNQLSNWLSQINNNVDVGVNYRTNREMKSDEVQVALSTQLFNDRLTINGSVDMATNAAANASDNIVGEFDIDYKLVPNGKFRLKTYNHINNDMLYDNLYTQGLGVFYKEEFNTVGELWKRYLNSIFGKKEEEPALPKDPDPGS
jgi:hypothetical protein